MWTLAWNSRHNDPQTGLLHAKFHTDQCIISVLMEKKLNSIYRILRQPRLELEVWLITLWHCWFVDMIVVVVKYPYIVLYHDSSLKRSGIWHVLTTDHTVLPATHMFIHKWNEPYPPLLPSDRASPHFSWYSFPIPLMVGGWVGLVKYWGGLSAEDGHPSQY